MKHLKTAFIFGAISFSTLSLSPALASDEVKKFPAGGASDLLDPPKNPVKEGSGALKIQKDCKTSEGKIVLKGDPAYEACLKEKLEKPKK